MAEHRWNGEALVGQDWEEFLPPTVRLEDGFERAGVSYAFVYLDGALDHPPDLFAIFDNYSATARIYSDPIDAYRAFEEADD